MHLSLDSFCYDGIRGIGYNTLDVFTFIGSTVKIDAKCGMPQVYLRQQQGAPPVAKRMSCILLAMIPSCKQQTR